MQYKKQTLPAYKNYIFGLSYTDLTVACTDVKQGLASECAGKGWSAMLFGTVLWFHVKTVCFIGVILGLHT